MRLSILASELSRKELLQKNIPAEIIISWKTSIDELVPEEADAYFDLLFVNEKERINHLKTLLPAPIFINSVTATLSEIGAPFIRLNGWPGFLGKTTNEIVTDSQFADKAETVLKALGWQYKAVPDQPGMIVPRVVSMIVNEAYFALGEEVSSKEEIDTAMKLGTNYPYGPFEWAQLIGLDKIKQLLEKLSETDERYLMAEALTKETV